MKPGLTSARIAVMRVHLCEDQLNPPTKLVAMVDEASLSGSRIAYSHGRNERAPGRARRDDSLAPLAMTTTVRDFSRVAVKAVQGPVPRLCMGCWDGRACSSSSVWR
jgi:hypothetical protein